MALPARVPGHRDPSTHLRAAHPTGGGRGPARGLAGIPKSDAADGVGGLLASAENPHAGGADCRPAGPRRPAGGAVPTPRRELWTADRDFGRFQGLTVRNPLVG